MKKLSEEHYVMVDDSEIKQGDWVVGCTRTVVQCMYPENVHHRDVKKITHSTQPESLGMGWMQSVQPLFLSEVKELLGVVDVEKKAELYVWGGVYLSEQEKQQTEIAYMTGYNQALEDNKEKKYTEEDIRKTWEAGMRFIGEDKGSYGEFIQSLQPKTEWEAEFVDGKLKLIQ